MTSGTGDDEAAPPKRGEGEIRLAIAVLVFALLAWQNLPLRGVGVPQLILIGTVVGCILGAWRARRREHVAAGLLVTAAVLLRLQWFHAGHADPIVVSQAAFARVLAGGVPYGAPYAESVPSGAHFVYGPLAMVWWLPGADLELIATLGILGLLWWQRSWVAMAVFGSLSISVQLNTVGVNDYSPALMLLVAVIAFRTRPVAGAGLLAITAALKPYAFAWFLPAIGYGGLATAGVLLGATAILWSPLFLWWGGLEPYLRSAQDGLTMHGAHREAALNVPILRWAATLFAVLGLFVRTWEGMVVAGSAAFTIFLFFGNWSSAGYWLVLIPILGLVFERGDLLGTLRHGTGVASRSTPTPTS